MTEALRSYDYDDYASEEAADDDLATSYLESNPAQATQTVEQVEVVEHSVEDSGPLIVTDWLTLLTPRPTVDLPDEEPEPQPQPEGMSKHLAPPRMRPTFGVRLGSGLRRLVLSALLVALASAILAGGAYFLLGSTWLAPAVPGIGPATRTEPESPEGSAPRSAPPAANSLPSDYSQMRDQGVRELRAGHYNNAIDLLEYAAAVNEGDAVTEYQLGLAYLGVPDREHSAQDAEMALRSAISLQPAWAAPYTLLAESLMRQGQSQDAVTPAKKATELDPSKPEAWMTLGRAYQGAGNQAEATRAFAQAARLAPAPPNP
jgi:Flp pilus assembly protein TadD